MHANVFGIEDPRHHIWKKVFITRGAATQAVFRGYLTHLENETWRESGDRFFAAKLAEKKQIVADAGWQIIEYRLVEVPGHPQ
ncbi:MAG: hypothetical protein ACLP8A_10485 [Methylovirgula sp.]